jgi:hypothetical protein
MASERQLLLGSEDAHAHPAAVLDGGALGQDESRLREIHLARQRLHLSVAEPAAVSEHGEGISLQRFRAEHIQLHKSKTAQMQTSWGENHSTCTVERGLSWR